jgi:hypothetical protein
MQGVFAPATSGWELTTAYWELLRRPAATLYPIRSPQSTIRNCVVPRAPASSLSSCHASLVTYRRNALPAFFLLASAANSRQNTCTCTDEASLAKL